ncbi:unnamed protein product [[Actinomadura] parvosata subsp. kistnae]|nr:unnamed protein product [Actinomadura parvosata subsp. kistnae]
MYKPQPSALDQARATTDKALQHLRDLIDGGMDVGLSREFMEAFTVEMHATRAKADQMSAEIDALADKAKILEEHVLKAFQWGAMSAWQIASELDMSAIDIARTALDERKRSPFSDAECHRLLSTLFSILDEREGVTFDHANNRCNATSCACNSEAREDTSSST